MPEKTYKIIKSYRDKETVIEGTLAELTKHFSYTLLLGHQENPKIKKEPKDIKALMNNLQKAFDTIERACYTKTYVDLA